jgi:hypothetical protein
MTIHRRIKDGRLQAFHWVGRTLIKAEDLKAVMDAASGRQPEG